jgi:hypothetical protein
MIISPASGQIKVKTASDRHDDPEAIAYGVVSGSLCPNTGKAPLSSHEKGNSADDCKRGLNHVWIAC